MEHLKYFSNAVISVVITMLCMCFGLIGCTDGITEKDKKFIRN